MAQQTTKEILKLVEYQIEQIFTEVEKIKEDNRASHDEVKDDLRFIKNNLFDPKEGIWTEVKDDLRFIKNNLFDPKEGIWTEVKDNSNFRKETVKWRNALGFGVFSLIGKHIWDFIKGT